jgi:hypothetical protein
MTKTPEIINTIKQRNIIHKCHKREKYNSCQHMSTPAALSTSPQANK